jgi:hypothetical protein
MSSEEREQFRREVRGKLRKIGYVFAGFFVFWILFSRTPHKAYSEYNGTLIPIDPVSAYQYPDQFMQKPGPYPNTQASNPYLGQPINPYAGQPYQPPGPYPVQSQGYPANSPTQSYGSQYPQAQYLAKHNEYVQQQSVPYSQQQYSSMPPVQPKSQYTVERPQAHQPYPNSPYAERPIQSNYKPGFHA